MGKNYSHAHLVKCSSCGLVFANEIPTPKELQAHYARYLRGYSLSPVTAHRYEELLNQFEPSRKLNRILDIGCGDGYFLAAAQRKGWEVFGSEYTDEAVSISRAKSISVHKGPLKDFVADPFDVITSFEVLEHLNDGQAHAAEIFSLLRKNWFFALQKKSSMESSIFLN